MLKKNKLAVLLTILLALNLVFTAIPSMTWADDLPEVGSNDLADEPPAGGSGYVLDHDVEQNLEQGNQDVIEAEDQVEVKEDEISGDLDLIDEPEFDGYPTAPGEDPEEPGLNLPNSDNPNNQEDTALGAPFIDGDSQQIPGVDSPNHEFNVPTPVGAPSDPTAPAKYVITCDEDHDIYYEANDLETLNKLLRGNTDDAFGEGSYIVENNHYVLTFNDDLIFTSNSENLTFYGAHGKVAYWKVEGNGHTIKSNLTDMSSKG